MKVVYIVGPFRAGSPWEIEQNVRRAEEAALKVWKCGAAAICPHANTRFFQETLPDRVWLKGDSEILTRCDAVLVVRGWEKSAGSNTEIYRAISKGIKVFFDESFGELEEWLRNPESPGRFEEALKLSEKEPRPQIPINPDIATMIRNVFGLESKTDSKELRFVGGAVRDSNIDKLNYAGFLSPLVLRAFARYMHKHKRFVGGMREADNWKSGMPKRMYLESLFRHLIDLWLCDEGWKDRSSIEDALCGILFNASGYLHELERVSNERRDPGAGQSSVS